MPMPKSQVILPKLPAKEVDPNEKTLKALEKEMDD